MRSVWRPLTCAVFSTFFVLLLTACGLVVTNPALFGSGDAAVTIALTGPSTVMLGGQSQYAATVSGSSDATVTWSVNGVAGGDATVGSISAQGLYLAPASAPKSSQVTITATSVASPSISKSLPIVLAAPSQNADPEPIVVSLSGSSSVTLGTSSQYVATVTGSENTAVTWSVNGAPGGNVAVGYITASGLYTAPQNAPQPANVTITATSVADPSISEGLAVLLNAPPQAPGANGASSAVSLVVSGPTSVTLGTSAQYAANVTGSQNTAVTWSVNGVAGGNGTVGSISPSGLYSAPADAPQPSNVTITATSVVDSSVSGGLAVVLTAPPQAPGGNGPGSAVSLVVSGPTSVTVGTSAQYTASVTGSQNTAVIWSVNSVAGGDGTVGSISASGLYSAPASAPQPSNVTITATSVADPSVSQGLAVVLVAAPQSPGGGGVGPTVTLSLSGPTSVTLGALSQYVATVTGTSNSGVIWSVDGVVGGNQTVGSISTTGFYTAPDVEPSSSQVTITAISVADTSVTQSLTVTLVAPPPPPPTLTLTGATSVTLGTSSQYAAVVSGSSNTGVTWSVNGVVGGNAAYGSISTSGRYTAPASAPGSSTVTITATSAADPSVARSLTVTLVAPPPPPPAITLTLSGASAVKFGTSSQYAAVVSGSSNTGVTWSVNGVVGGNAACGSISTSGRYTAPTSAPGSLKVTITATSVANPSVARSLTVTLVAPPPAVTLTLTGATTVTLGNSSQYAAAVTGSSNAGVTWSVNGVVGGNRTVGLISGLGLYTAPATAPGSSKVTIKAASVADPSVARSLVVALAAPPPPPPPPVKLAVSGASSVTLGTSSQYAATVTGTSDISVAWSVDGVVGGDRTVGTISAKGLYAAPVNPPQSSKVTITATSMADPSVSQSLSVVLAPPKAPQVTLALSGITTVTLGTSSQYAATVKGSTNTAVTWSVDGLVGGDSTIGSISAKGLYTAPAHAPQSPKVTITATSVANPAVSQSLVVVLEAPQPPSVTLTLGGATTVTWGTSSQYVATVTGSVNASVVWSVNGVTGGSATDGTISIGGLYNAPASAAQISTVTITATSVANPAVAKSLVVTLVAPVSSSHQIPSYAISSGPLEGSTRWKWNHDAGTPGSSQGSSVYPISGLSSDNAAREFYMTYSNHGGEIYHLSFATDLKATHFVYDANVYVVDPSQLANLEMDMNDVMSDGRTVILGTQCSTYAKTWEFVYQGGGHPHWHASNIACDPRKWSANTWHHIQIASHRDANGIVTYDWVGVDGVYTDFQNATYDSAYALGWAKGDLLINFQIDGYNSGSGSNTLYTDKLTIYRW